MTTDYKSMFPEEIETLGEKMYANGYLTHAIGDNPMLARRNFRQGFVGYNFFPKREDTSPSGQVLKKIFAERFKASASTEDLTRFAIEWLDENYEKDFFLWIHYFDPHLPYSPPRKYMDGTKAPAGMAYRFNSKNAVKTGSLKLTAEQREWVHKLYDGEVRYVDDNVGELLGHLKELNIYDDSVIILTSDHGEEFWEHGNFEHGHCLYNEVIHVPLMIKAGGSTEHTSVESKVCTESIFATVLEYCGVEYEEEKIEGRSLVDYPGKVKKNVGGEAIFSSGLLFYEDKKGVVFDDMPYKYIFSPASGRDELFNLETDRTEGENLSEQAEEKVRQGEDLLEEHEQISEKLKVMHGFDEAEEVTLDPDTRRRLKSLGYID